MAIWILKFSSKNMDQEIYFYGVNGSFFKGNWRKNQRYYRTIFMVTGIKYTMNWEMDKQHRWLLESKQTFVHIIFKLNNNFNIIKIIW